METKAVIFDFDGTLSDVREGNGTWYEIWKYLGDLDIDDKYYKMFKNGEVTDKEWVDLVIGHYVSRGLSKSDLQNISKEIKLIDNIREVFKTLKNNDIKIFILSGGIKPLISNVLKREKVDKFITDFVAYDFLYDENDKLVKLQEPEVVIEPKHEYVENIKTNFHLKPEQILYVGNDYNDEDVYLSGVHTLCINPRFTDISNKKIWHNALEVCPDLRDVLQFVNFSEKQLQ